jgi:hypothetical protein
MGFLKGRFASLRGLRQQIDSPRDHKRTLAWIKTCIVIHSLISFIECAAEDGDFVEELMREGLDGELDAIGLEHAGPSDTQREVGGQRRRTLLKEKLFESLADNDISVFF